ncbi:MAG: YggS family pyridoxal phosphate-dependent enzyme [bacterium]|nr:YggS family pyridoxal phosphate-dependent enzyme [bacterium]
MKTRLDQVRGKIAAALLRSGRTAGRVQLLAVSKHQPFSAVLEAWNAGQTLFAESYAQELVTRLADVKARPELSSTTTPLQFDFVGRLQGNKVKTVVGACRMLHSIDRFSIADAVNRQAERFGVIQSVLMQVNISGEETKSGVRVEDAPRLLEELLRLPGLHVEGLMSFGRYVPPDAPYEMRAREFIDMVQLRDSLAGRFEAPLAQLSMGVSHDYEVAVEQGATIVRVGAGIFGPR